jgi:hypothetical protein
MFVKKYFKDIAVATRLEIVDSTTTTRQAEEKMIDNLYSLIKDLDIKKNKLK